MIDPHDDRTGDLLTQRPARASLLTHLRDTLRQIKALETQERRLRLELAENCEHEDVREYHREHADGYGRQSQNTGLRCTICGAIKYYLTNSRWSGGYYQKV